VFGKLSNVRPINDIFPVKISKLSFDGENKYLTKVLNENVELKNNKFVLEKSNETKDAEIKCLKEKLMTSENQLTMI